MKKITAITVSMLFALNFWGQNLKTYSGPYKISNSLFRSGKATYNYFIKDGEEVKHGNFTFSGSANNYRGGVTVKISGKYKSGLKSGLWIYSVTLKETGKSNTIMTLKANYLDGLPNGVWVGNFNKKRYNSNISATWKLSAKFLKGCLIGDFIFNFKSPTNLDNMVIKLDNEGYYISEKIRENQDVTERNYYKRVLINPDLGKEKTKKIVDEIDSLTSRNITLDDYPYILKERQDEFPKSAYIWFFNSLYLFQDIGGDVNYKSTDYYNNQVYYDYDGFKYFVLVRHKTLTELYTDELKNGNEHFDSGLYEEAIVYYNKALEFKQTDYAKKQIELCQQRIKEIAEEKERKYNTNIQKADSFFNNYKFETAKLFYKNALAIKENDQYAQNRVYLINKIKSDPDYFYKKGNQFSQNKQLDSTIHYYRIVYAYYADNPGVANSLAWSLLLNKNFEEAKSILKKALETTEKSDHTYPYLLGNLAHSYLLTGEKEKAKEIYYSNTDLLINEMPWADAVVTDFNQFIDLGINNEFYYEIAKKLKRKKMLNVKK